MGWVLALLEVVRLPHSIVRRLRVEAEKLSMGLEEYLVELVTRDLDPLERVREYVEVARGLLEQARWELGRGNVRWAAEKAWGATALAVKAYAAWREGKRLTSHGELWKYTLVLREELEKWVISAWNAGNSMHTCFYEGWCSREHVKDAIKEIERLVKTIEEKIKGTSR